MRPPLLNPLFRPVTSLDGIGDKLAQALRRLLGGGDLDGAPRVGDLLFHLPSAIIDRRNQPEIALAPAGMVVTLKVRVDRHQRPPPGNRRAPYKVFAHDVSGEIALTFFHANEPWLARTFPIGETVYVSGTMEWFGGRPSMVHPDHVVREADLATLPLVEPVYPLTAGLTGKVLARTIGEALDSVPPLPEWLDPLVVAREAWPSFAEALHAAHHPQGAADLEPSSRHLARLAYDELLASQLALAIIRHRQRKSVGAARLGTGQLTARIVAALPFTLTGSQRNALAEIEADLAKPERMLRLLQGDVGSGKTIVALLASASVIESGAQAALMAPTELLARQHARTIAPLADAAGIRMAILTGREKGRDREETLAGLASGAIDLVVGTHAIFQAGVAFDDLGLVAVDEQHRFGVHQRLALTAKGKATDVLVMTATPIPRTLVLTYYGDMDVSRLTEKPAGRKPIETRVLPLTRLEEIVARIREAVSRDAKAYWICPLVAESEELDVAAAEDRYTALVKALGPIVGLAHGQMKPAERDKQMAAFQAGMFRVLVATTVVEVGVDVPDATIIVIEHAERFGLAQLHQLRGRVGRSDRPSVCLLLYKAPLGAVARDRLAIMRETEDGFVIAEEDLRLRGGGEILGTRQSGMPGFRIASTEIHATLMEMARDDAQRVVEHDPELAGPRGEALRLLLYVFGRDEAVRLLRAG